MTRKKISSKLYMALVFLIFIDLIWILSQLHHHVNSL